MALLRRSLIKEKAPLAVLMMTGLMGLAGQAFATAQPESAPIEAVPPVPGVAASPLETGRTVSRPPLPEYPSAAAAKSKSGWAEAAAPPIPGLAYADTSRVAFPAERREEPLESGSAGASPVEISQVPPTPLAAGQISSVYRRQAYVVANYITRRNKNLRWDEVSLISDAIVQYSNRYGVDYRLLTSVIAIESSFRRDAVSSSGAIGMGQLKPETARWLGVVDPYDPVDNIAGTARFLAWLTRKYGGDLERALSAYYQGPGYVDRNGITAVCMPYLVKINTALGSLL